MYMKNFLKITIACLIASAFQAYSQESSESVDIGFGVVQDRKTSTASTATVESSVLEERATINVNDALYGRLLGLTAIKSSGNGWVGDANFGASFNIRGIQTSFDNGNGYSENNRILVLVDGFPRSIDRLSIDEVESVTVLKDAAALALYGYTGVNGAINIKTKRGVATASGMQVKVKFHHKFTFQPQLTEYADAYTYAQAMNEARRNDGMAHSYNQFEVDAFRSGAFPKVYPNVDWQKEALREVGSEDVLSMSFSNRTEKTGFFSLLNYTNSQGLINGADVNKAVGRYSTQLKYSKANVRTNLDVALTSSTKFEANILGSLFETNRPSGINADTLFRTLNYLPSAAFPVKTADALWGGSYNFNNLRVFNPVARIQNSGYYREIGVILNTDFKLTQSLDEILQGLSISGRFGYDAYNVAFENRSKLYSWANDRFAFDNAGNPIVGNPIREEDYQTQTTLNFSRGNVSTSRSMNFVLSADYQKQIDRHNLTASLIYHWQNSVSKNRYNTFYRANVMGYIHYDLANKYIADIVLTYTGSNRSYPKSWVLSPTVSLGWLLTEEDFLKDNAIVNLLKLRGSYGMLHSDNVPRNGSIWMSIYDWGPGGFSLTNPTGAVSGYGGRMQINLPTTNFKLETAHKANIGLEALLINSLGVTIDAYYQRRSNILQYEGPLFSAMSGVGAGYGNTGIIDSKGIEFGLNFNKKFGDLTVNFDGMLTYGINKVIDCVEEPRAYPWLLSKGYAVDQPRGLVYTGFFKDAAEIAKNPKQEFSLTRPGDAIYQRQAKDEGDQAVNTDDRIPIGYSTQVPRVNYAFNAGLEFKGFGANILFQGVGQFNRWEDQRHWNSQRNQNLLPLVQGRNIPVEYYENRWVKGFDNSVAKYPALSTLYNANNDQESTLWLRDAAFLKIRHAEVYYRFPTAMLKKLSLSGLKLSITGENFYTWTPYTGMDPERSGFTYPTLPGVSAGLSVTF